MIFVSLNLLMYFELGFVTAEIVTSAFDSDPMHSLVTFSKSSTCQLHLTLPHLTYR